MRLEPQGMQSFRNEAPEESGVSNRLTSSILQNKGNNIASRPRAPQLRVSRDASPKEVKPPVVKKGVVIQPSRARRNTIM